MRNRIRQYNQGFTLIELLVYVTLLVLIVGSVSILIFGALKSHVQTRAMRDVMNNITIVIDAVALEVKEAQGVYDSTTSATQLSLETIKTPPTGETTTYVDFFICDIRLCIKRESQDPIALTSESVEIRGLIFEKISTGSIPSIQMTLRIGSVNPYNRSELEAELEIISVVSFRTY